VSPELFKKRDWCLLPDYDEKQFVMKNYDLLWSRFYWNHNPSKLPIIPVIHGTDYVTAQHICNTGFATVSSLDAGFYGQGMYFSSSIQYAIPYFTTKASPCLVLCYALPGNVYPVTEEASSPRSLTGKPVMTGYHSHYVLTNHSGGVYDVNRDPAFFDEIVFFQECQVVPAYMILLDKSNVQEIKRKWDRKEI